MKNVTYYDRHGRFTKSEVEEILSRENRRECQDKLKRIPHTDDLIKHWVEKNQKK